MLRGGLRNAGNNTQGVYDQYSKAVQLRPDIGFDLLSAACAHTYVCLTHFMYMSCMS